MTNIFTTPRTERYALALQKLAEEFYKEFLDRGIDYTRGYIDGRKGMIIGNFFSVRYTGAKRALNTLEAMTKYSQ